MTTTLADTIAETRRRFLNSHRDQVNILTTTIGAADTSLDLVDPPATIQAGTDLAIGLEVMRVRSVVGQTATVIRGFAGSTAASHASGALVYANPIISNFDIFREICNDLSDLCSPGNGLFKVTSYEFTYNPNVQGYEIPTANVLDVLSVRYKDTGPWRSWPTIESWRFDEGASTTDFAAGQSLTLYEGGYPGNTVHVTLAVDFTAPTALTSDMQADVGLPSSANDLPAIGAAIRLAAGREITRNLTESQGQARRAQEVPPGAILGSTRGLQQLRHDRIVAEANRLRSSYPLQRRR
jgi:hypothetical protein